MKPAQAMTAVKAGDQCGGVVLAVMALLFMPALIFIAVNLFELLGDADVVARQPIGQVLRMSAAGGFSERIVLETTGNFYPLQGVASIAKGEVLTLELRRSGRRYVCNVTRTLCLETSREHFSVDPKSSQP